MSDSAKRKAAENHCDRVAPSISWSYTHRRVVEESFEAGWDAAIEADRTKIARLEKIEARAKEVLREREDSTAAYILEGGTRHVGKPDARKGAAMDRAALIAELRDRAFANLADAAHSGISGIPADPWEKAAKLLYLQVRDAADALASDAKLLEKLKALCFEREQMTAGEPNPAFAAQLTTAEIRAALAQTEPQT